MVQFCQHRFLQEALRLVMKHGEVEPMGSFVLSARQAG